MNFGKLDYNSSEPLYLQVAHNIEQKIANKEFAVGQKLPPQEKLCKILNVSIPTIKGALSNLVEMGYISRRRNLGTFIISTESNKGIDFKRKNKIGVLFHNPEISVIFDPYRNPYFYRMLAGIEEEIKEKKLYMLYSSINNGAELYLSGKEKDIAGLILVGEMTQEILNAVKKTNLPFILIGDVAKKTVTQENVDIICNDDFESIYKATKYLIGLGHKRIAYFTCFLERYSWEIEQLKGYKQALKEANIVFDKDLLIETGKGDPEIGYSVMKEFLDKSRPFTALLSLNHPICQGAIRAINEKGLKVPDDISILSSTWDKALTSITVDLEEIGRTAVEKLIEKITDINWQPKRIVVPAQLIIRDSVRQIEDVTEKVNPE